MQTIYNDDTNKKHLESFQDVNESPKKIKKYYNRYKARFIKAYEKKFETEVGPKLYQKLLEEIQKAREEIFEALVKEFGELIAAQYELMLQVLFSLKPLETIEEELDMFAFWTELVQREHRDIVIAILDQFFEKVDNIYSNFAVSELIFFDNYFFGFWGHNYINWVFDEDFDE
jgi:hypothetical protein